MLPNHPTKDIQGLLSGELAGKKIVLAMAGSVGIIKSPELARLLIRHGAEVIPIMSKDATELIQPALLEWSTGNRVITQITGAVEHVEHCGNTTTKADLLLIYPATANTLSKIACGIDDTPVTTFATTAIGEQIPVMIVPAMHLPMFHHPAVRRNMDQLKQDGIILLEPTISEGKAKVLSPQEVTSAVLKLLSTNEMEKTTSLKMIKGRAKKLRFLITSGRTVESIDPFRVITNRSSGKMGRALAQGALSLGAEVTLISGAHNVDYPVGVNLIEVESTLELLDTVKRELTQNQFDVIICAAAVADWMPQERATQKISTDCDKLELILVPTPKIINSIREIAPKSFLVAFRALSGMSNDQMLANGKERLEKARADLICINAIDRANCGFEAENNELILFSKDGEITEIPNSSKEKCGKQIIEVIYEKFN